MYTDLIIAEIHQAINKLGGSARPATPNDADRALRDLGADIDLISIVDSWQDTLPDEDILQLLISGRSNLWTVVERLGRVGFRFGTGTAIIDCTPLKRAYKRRST